MRGFPRASPGFTLIELLVVIAIIGCLVGLLVPAVQSGRQCFNQDSAETAIVQIADAQGFFRSLDSDGDAVDDYGRSSSSAPWACSLPTSLPGSATAISSPS